MATEPTTPVERPEPVPRTAAAAAAGVVGGLALGILLQFGLNSMTAVGALYTLGERSTTVGWVAHAVHSVLFGALFGLAGASNPVARRLQDALGETPGLVAAGAGYATLLWLVNVVVVWPLWLNAVSFGPAPAFPYLAPMPLVGHLVYGTLLGGVFAALNGRR